MRFVDGIGLSKLPKVTVLILKFKFVYVFGGIWWGNQPNKQPQDVVWLVGSYFHSFPTKVPKVKKMVGYVWKVGAKCNYS